MRESRRAVTRLALTIRCAEWIAATPGIAESVNIVPANHKEAIVRIFPAVALSVLVLASSAQAKRQSKNPPAKPQSSREQSAPASGSNGASAGQAKIDPAKEADIRRLQDLAGTKAAMTQMIGQMEKNMKPLLMNSLPPGDYREKLADLFFDKFQDHLKSSLQQLLDSAVPLYDKYFSSEDVKGLIDFYSTPLGQKAVTALPKLSLELQTEGTKLGEKLGSQSMLEVLAEHPELKKAIEDAVKSAQQPQ
jgi:uncharacterized protein